jgi:hypothetical protein
MKYQVIRFRYVWNPEKPGTRQLKQEPKPKYYELDQSSIDFIMLWNDKNDNSQLQRNS